MSLKKYIILMFIIAMICSGGWVLVLYNINPDTAGWIGLSLFYFSLFWSLVATLATMGLLIRLIFLKRTDDHVVVADEEVGQVKVALRQGVWFGLLVIICLMLQHIKLLTWWNALILVLALTILEFFFVAYQNED